MFKVGDVVDIAGKTVGKGFQGGIKRWGMTRGPRSHGSHSMREVGSIGQNTTPGRVYPGKRMPGHMGHKRSKAKGLKILAVDLANRAIIVKGCFPGKPGHIVEVAPAKIVGKTIFPS